MRIFRKIDPANLVLEIANSESVMRRYTGIAFVSCLLMTIATRSLQLLSEIGWSTAQWLVFPTIMSLLSISLLFLVKGSQVGFLLLKLMVWLILPLFAFGLITVGSTPYAVIPGAVLLSLFLLPSQQRRFYLYLGLFALLFITLQNFTGDELLYGLRSLSATLVGGLVFIRMLAGEKAVVEGESYTLRDFIGLFAALGVLVVPVWGLVSDDFGFSHPEGTLMAAGLFIGHAVLSKFFPAYPYRATLFLILFWFVTVYELYTNQEAGMLFLPAAAVAVYFVASAQQARRFMLSLLIVVLLGFAAFVEINDLELFPRLFILAVVCWLLVDLVAMGIAHRGEKQSQLLGSEQGRFSNVLWIRTTVFTVLITTLVLMASVPIIQHIDRTRYQEQLAFAASHLESNVHQFEQDMLRFVGDLNLRARSNLSQKYLTAPSSSLHLLLESDLVSLVENEPFLLQARLLDSSGQEIIRANKDKSGVYAVEPSQLQDKSARPYFYETIAMGLNEFYISEIDLNIENGTVQVPHQPVLRMAAPAFDTLGNRRGVWVFNFDADALLKNYAQYDPHSEELNFLVASSGSLINAPQGYPLWADSLDLEGAYFEDSYPDIWQQIELRKNSGSVEIIEQGDQVAFMMRVNLSQTVTERMQRELDVNLSETANFTQIKSSNPVLFIQLLPKESLAQFALIGSPVALFWLVVTLLLILLVAFSITSLMARSEELELKSRQLAKTVQLAEQSAESKGRFLATMSHEIRTPLNGVLGMLVLAKEECADTQLKSRLNLIESSANALRNIVDDILDISRLEQGGIMLEKRSFSPKSMLEEVSALFKPVAQQKGVELEIQSQLATSNLLGDNHRIKQILSNLVGNAIKFTEQGCVTIRSELVDAEGVNPRWQIAVEDTGIGMSADQVERLFERFTQADDSISRRFGGSGLGLSISKQLAELMQGGITVTSKEGEGSCFTLELPVELASADQIQTEVQALNPFDSVKELAGKRLLVVDDSPTNRMVAQGLLNKMGMQVTTADGGQAALAAIRESLPDLILLDIHMPEMDGLAVAKAIRAGEAGDEAKALPIIALTAAAFESDRKNALNAGMNGFLSKPINPAELAAELLDKLAD